MLKLYGFPVSNYVNMVEFALLEKGIPYEYVLTFPDQSEELLSKSPRGKLPALGTPEGYLSEASVIMEYLEDLGQGKPLLPREPYARGRVRALLKEIELYIELPARTCFAQAFFGGTVPDAIKAKAKEDLIYGIAAIKRHASFAPYIAGAEFTIADVMFYFGVGIAAAVAQSVFDMNLIAEIPGAKQLMDQMSENPHLRKLAAARDAALPAFIESARARLAANK